MEDFSKVHEAIEWIAGYHVWTHELPSIREKVAASAKAQFPWLPMGEVADWRATAQFLLDNYGPTVAVEQGAGKRNADPITTLRAILQQKEQP